MPTLATGRRILRRFHRRAWDEIRTRAAQECWKRVDRLAFPLHWRPAAMQFDGPPAAAGRFFFTPEEVPEIVRLWLERLPDEARETISQAERICRHEFDLLGYEGLYYGAEIDWHLDARHGKRAPRKAWYRIHYLDFAEVGDHKIIWELNRHQHLVTLAKAYRLTGEQRFAAELFSQWQHWQKRNRYPVGINWASGLEVGFRALSWLWVKHLLAGCAVLPADFERALRGQLALSGRHIERYLSTYFSPNTHLLGEGVALFFIGTLEPGLAAARRWRNLGWRITLGEAGRQVRPDGLHFEQSLYYHVYALDLFLHARALARANRIAIPEGFDERLLNMLQVLKVVAYNGPPARFGDDDGGRVFNPRRNRAEHLRDPLATGAAVFGRADFKRAAGGWLEETLWLLGPQAAPRFDELAAEEPAPQSRGFAASGLYVMHGSQPAPERLVILAGQAATSTAGHAHADALSAQVVVNGREWLADPGTGCYVSATGREREAFRSTAAHNTLWVNRLGQADRAGPFAWRGMPHVEVDAWIAGETFDLFAGRHDGYQRLPEPVTHRRWVFRSPAGFCLVRDVAEGKGVHQLELRWHLGPGFKLQKCGGAATLACSDHPADPGCRLAFLPAEGHGWVEHFGEGEVSPVYGVTEAAPVLSFRRQVAVPAEFAILLIFRGQALGDTGADLGRLMRVEAQDPNATATGYQYRASGSRHFMAFAEPGQPWKLDPWASDAAFVCVEAPLDGPATRVILCRGSYLELAGHRFVTCDPRPERLEWASDRDGEHVSCSRKDARLEWNREGFPREW